ncbi:hypothetical protein PAPYR_2513 [Paratrimastix pyriformis]|uniref:Uncharacterized protein n=1 Tax=Paratrimastix pyriformis TaxID=342808 RepID=A0ABQ8UPG0_9EUKA|nr:hypothetical protein PAPYR_2513 [Paratrimastix pyriformis]
MQPAIFLTDMTQGHEDQPSECPPMLAALQAARQPDGRRNQTTKAVEADGTSPRGAFRPAQPQALGKQTAPGGGLAQGPSDAPGVDHEATEADGSQPQALSPPSAQPSPISDAGAHDDGGAGDASAKARPKLSRPLSAQTNRSGNLQQQQQQHPPSRLSPPAEADGLVTPPAPRGGKRPLQKTTSTGTTRVARTPRCGRELEVRGDVLEETGGAPWAPCLRALREQAASPEPPAVPPPPPAEPASRPGPRSPIVSFVPHPEAQGQTACLAPLLAQPLPLQPLPPPRPRSPAARASTSFSSVTSQALAATPTITTSIPSFSNSSSQSQSSGSTDSDPAQPPPPSTGLRPDRPLSGGTRPASPEPLAGPPPLALTTRARELLMGLGEPVSATVPVPPTPAPPSRPAGPSTQPQGHALPTHPAVPGVRSVSTYPLPVPASATQPPTAAAPPSQQQATSPSVTPVKQQPSVPVPVPASIPRSQHPSLTPSATTAHPPPSTSLLPATAPTKLSMAAVVVGPGPRPAQHQPIISRPPAATAAPMARLPQQQQQQGRPATPHYETPIQPRHPSPTRVIPAAELASRALATANRLALRLAPCPEPSAFDGPPHPRVPDTPNKATSPVFPIRDQLMMAPPPSSAAASALSGPMLPMRPHALPGAPATTAPPRRLLLAVPASSRQPPQQPMPTPTPPRSPSPTAIAVAAARRRAQGEPIDVPELPQGYAFRHSLSPPPPQPEATHSTTATTTATRRAQSAAASRRPSPVLRTLLEELREVGPPQPICVPTLNTTTTTSGQPKPQQKRQEVGQSQLLLGRSQAPGGLSVFPHEASLFPTPRPSLLLLAQTAPPASTASTPSRPATLLQYAAPVVPHQTPGPLAATTPVPATVLRHPSATPTTPSVKPAVRVAQASPAVPKPANGSPAAGRAVLTPVGRLPPTPTTTLPPRWGAFPTPAKTPLLQLALQQAQQRAQQRELREDLAEGSAGSQTGSITSTTTTTTLTHVQSSPQLAYQRAQRQARDRVKRTLSQQILPAWVEPKHILQTSTMMDSQGSASQQSLLREIQLRQESLNSTNKQSGSSPVPTPRPIAGVTTSAVIPAVQPLAPRPPSPLLPPPPASPVPAIEAHREMTEHMALAERHVAEERAAAEAQAEDLRRRLAEEDSRKELERIHSMQMAALREAQALEGLDLVMVGWWLGDYE